LDESNPDHAEVLNDIKRRFREETFTREYIEQILQAHPELVRELGPLSKRTN
jgi:glutamate dehydrogenase